MPCSPPFSLLEMELSWSTIGPERASRWLVLAAACALCGCGSDEPAPEPESIEVDRGDEQDKLPESLTDDESMRAQLEAIGYVDFGDSQTREESSGVVVHDQVRSQPGFNLYTAIPFGIAVLLDPSGRVIHEWGDERDEDWKRAKLAPDGRLLVVGESRQDPTESSWLRCLSWDGEELWQKNNGAHHDVLITEEGWVVTLTRRLRLIEEYDPERRVRDNGLARLSLEGGQVDSGWLFGVLSAKPEILDFYPAADVKHLTEGPLDPLHINSIFWMNDPKLARENDLYSFDHVLLSLRHQDAIAIVHWARKELVWAWGPGVIERQHEATVLDNGNILLLDNGTEERGFSRVVEMDPRTDEIVWEWRAPVPEDFFCAGRGTTQKLKNGNVLVSYSNNGEAFEITREGEVVWRFLSPFANEEGVRGTLRMTRYPNRYVRKILKEHPPG